MAAKAKKSVSSRKKTTAKKTESKTSKLETKKVDDDKKGVLTKRQKFVLIGVVLLAAFALLTGKQLFIAATVNGVPVSRLEVVRELEKQGGKQILDSIITEKLVLQEAKKANINVTEEEINKEIESLKQQMSAQGQDLDAFLTAQGMSQDELREQIKIYQIYPKKLLADQVEVTDDEVNSFVASYLSSDTTMDDNQKKDFAHEQILQQKLSEKLSTWLQEVKEKADINYFVEY